MTDVDLEGGSSKLYWVKLMPNKSTRYYHAEITEDLFDIIVFCHWGTVGTSRGGNISYPVASLKGEVSITDLASGDYI